jgi:hypothetical protein
VNVYRDHRARLRAAITTLWLAAAAALLTLTTHGPGRLVALGALVAAVAAGQLLNSARLAAVAGVGASSIALAALWAAGADPLAGVLAAAADDHRAMPLLAATPDRQSARSVSISRRLPRLACRPALLTSGCWIAWPSTR